MVKVKFYGKLRHIFGEEMEIEGISTVGELINALEKKSEEVKKIKEHLLFSINGRQVKSGESIKEGEDVAVFLPPTGG